MADATVTLEVEAGNISSKLIREMAKTERSFMQTVQSAVSKGATAGVNEAKLDKVFSRAIDKASKHMAQASKLMEQAQKATDAEAKKALLERAQIQRKAAENIFHRETKHTRSLIERRWKAHKKAQEFLDKSNSERIGGLVEAFGALKGGDVKGAASAASGAAQVGAGLLGRGAGAAAAGGAAGGAAALGGAATALAAVAVPLAAVAGTLALIVKLIIDANAQAKEMNKTLLESAGAGDMMFSVMNDGSEQLRAGLQGLRAAATDFVHNVRWGTVADDMVKILTAANDAGLTYKEMAKDTGELVNGMKGYLGVTELALRYSKLLGVDAAELAGNIAEWEHDLGGGLKNLEESFARVTKIAMESGFGVKRFYSMIQQATSGMALYNNRIEETAKLLSTTADILGEQEAKEFIDTLQKGFADEDYSARLKRVLLTGTEDVKRIVSKQAVSTAEAFTEDFGPALSDSLDSVLAGTDMEGMGIELATDPTELVDQLGSMTKEQQSELIGTISATDEAAGRRMKGLIDLATAKATGNVDDLIGALDDVSPSGKLAMLLDKQILGNRTLASMSEREKQIFADTQGLSVKQVEALERLETTMLGQKKAAERGNEGVIRKLGLLSDDFDTKTPEQQKAELEKIAKSVKEQSDADFVQEYGKAEEEIAGALSQQEALAQSTVEHTRDMSNILENGVQFMLERIYSLLEKATAKFFGLSDWELDQKRKADESMREKLDQLGEGLSRAQDEERKAREAVATAKTVGEKEEAEKKLAEAESRTKQAEAQVELQKKALASLTVMGSGLFTRDLAPSDSETFQERAHAEAMGGRGGKELAAEALGPEGEKQLKEAEVLGRERQAGKGYGLQGALTEQAREVQRFAGGHNVNTRLAAGELPGMADVARTGADLGTLGTWRLGGLGIGGLFGAAGEAGQVMEGAEAQGELVKKSLDEQTEKLVKEEEAAREKQEEQAKKQLTAQEESKAEQERFRKEFPELYAEGEIRAEAAKTLHKAGMWTPENVDLLMGGGGLEAAARVRSQVASRAGETLTDEQRKLFKIGQYMKDFVYQSGGGFAQGTITPINRADQLLGAKPGGPVAEAVGGGRSNVVNITINGGDQARTYETVKRALRAAGIR